MRAVAAHQVPGGHPVGPLRAAHVRGHRRVVLADPGHLVSAAYAGAELAGVFTEQPFEPRLREMHRPYRGIRQACEVQLQAAERGSRGRADRAAAGRFDPVQQAPVAQQFHDLPIETVGLRGLSQPRLPLQYQRPHSGQAQLTGQHQAGRARAHDDHVGVHHWPRPA